MVLDGSAQRLCFLENSDGAEGCHFVDEGIVADLRINLCLSDEGQFVMGVLIAQLNESGLF